MITTSVSATAPSAQLARLLQFLTWTIPITFSFAVLYGVISIVGRDYLAGITSIVGVGFGILLLVARRQAYQGKLSMAVIMITSGQLGASIIIVLALPSMFPALALVPLLAVTIALPYTQGRLMRGLIIVSWLVTVMVVILGRFIDLIGVPPPPYTSPMLVSMLVMTIALILLLLWQFSHRLNETLAHAHAANEELAAANAALAGANQQVHAQLDQQRQLIELVTTLETPAVVLADQVLFVPIVGYIDNRRAQSFMARLLDAVSRHKSRLVVIDIAGVPVVDTTVAQGLIQTAEALHLLGCQVTISGISAHVAMTLVALGIPLDSIATVRSPQDALAQYQ